MRRSSVVLILLSVLSVFSIPARAQIISTGEDPSWARWKSISSGNYKIIYPDRLDSLSRVYAKALEEWRIPVSRSAGYVPNEKFPNEMPVVLHPWTASANGMVVWIPRSMSLYTVREAYNPDLLPWEKLLAIHEGRHVAQRQAWWSRAHYILGDLAEGFTTGLNLNLALIEGDAVATETALSDFGRGRQGDFLDYTRMALDTGERRDWYQWRWGSQTKYAQNYYALGYMTVAGMRHFHDDPLFINRYFQNTRKFLSLGNFQKTVKQATGKGFRASWNGLMEDWRRIWAEEDTLRGPFSQGKDVLKGERLFYSYSGTCGEWSVLSGLSINPTLVRIGSDGEKTTVRPFPAASSKLASDGKRLYWSEDIPVPRWSLAADSRIRYIEPESSGKKVFNLTSKGRYFNPATSGDGNIWAVEYPVEGGSALVRFSSDGSVLERILAPGNIQLLEPAVCGDNLPFVTGLDGNGVGIYSAANGKFSAILGPVPYKIYQIRGCSLPEGNGFIFTSDRDGTCQIYSYSLSDGKLRQLTNEKYGATDACLLPGNVLQYSALVPEGRTLRRTDADGVPVDPSTRHIYPVAETLSAQEKALAVPGSAAPSPSSPKAYHKFPHIFHIHSWAPFYFDYDNVSSMTGDEYYELAALGATVFFQNHLGTSSGQAGYSWHDGRNTGHLRFTYTGLPVAFSFFMDYNDREAAMIGKLSADSFPGADSATGLVRYRNKPLFSGTVRAYVPLNYSSGGWRRGFVPKVEFSWRNDRYERGYYIYENSGETDSGEGNKPVHVGENGSDPFSCLDASLRWYSMLPVPSSRIFPRLGLGLEAGMRTHFAMEGYYSPTVYAYAYGYLPGLTDTHGLKLSVLAEYQTKEDLAVHENTVDICPRGFSDTDLNRFFGHYCPVQAKFSADYAMPFAPVDWSFLGPIAYIRNFEFTPFADLSLLKYRSSMAEPSGFNAVWSAGADLTVHLSNLLWLPYDSRIGIRYARNGVGASHSGLLESAGIEAQSNYLGFIFSVDL